MTARRATQPLKRSPIRNAPAIVPAVPLLLFSLWCLAFPCLMVASLLPHRHQAGLFPPAGISWAGFLDRAGWLFLLGGSVVFGLVIGWLGVTMLASAVLLALCGRSCEGWITDRWIEPDNGMSGPSACVAFRFVPPGQPPVTVAEVNRRVHARCQCGDPVRVRYLRFWPRICRLP